MSCKILLFAAFSHPRSFRPWRRRRPCRGAPDGTGDPDATTCRPPQPLPSRRACRGRKVCKTNSQWALLRKNGQDISADGSQIIPDPRAAGAPMNCTHRAAAARRTAAARWYAIEREPAAACFCAVLVLGGAALGAGVAAPAPPTESVTVTGIKDVEAADQQVRGTA